MPAILTGTFPDPRDFVSEAPAADVAEWYAAIGESLAADTAVLRDAVAAQVRPAVGRAWLDQPLIVDNAVEHAPSVEIARYLWRLVDELWATAGTRPETDVQVTVFALPMVIVAGAEAGREGLVDGVLRDPGRVAAILREGRALGGSETIAISRVLVPAGRLGIANLRTWDAMRQLPAMDPAPPGEIDRLFETAPLHVLPGIEQAHLRFMVGTAIAAGGRDLLAHPTVDRWGAPLTRELGAQLAAPGVSLLPLPRPPGRPLPAQHQGLVAQREIGAQLFATNAIRRFRASVGEPSAVISSHRAPDAPGGGELRLSLSSPFEPRDAEGFRCPLYAIESVGTALGMLLDLLHDCRVQDIRLLAGVHADRVAGSDMPLFFRADAIPEGALLQ